VYLYSYAIGNLIKYGDKSERATIALNQTIEASKEKCSAEVRDWIDLGVNFAEKRHFDLKILDPSKNIGFLKHAFVLSFYFLKLMPQMNYE
jgi:hypothetical protein